MSKNILNCLIKNILLKKNNYNLLPINKTIIRLQNTIIKNNFNDDSDYDLSKTDKYEHQSYKSYLEDKYSNSSIAIDALIKLPKLTRNAASKIVSEWKAFETLSKPTILKNYELLHENGVEQSTLKDHPYALADTTINIKNKIIIFYDIKLDITDAISLFKLKLKDLKLFQQTHEKDKLLLDNYPNRILYLSDKLDCSVSKICEHISSNPHVLYINFEKIKSTTEFLLDVGVKTEHILSDLHVYKFLHTTVKRRVERAINAEINPIKPWVVRCPLSRIIDAENRLAKRKALLIDSGNIEMYISKLMNCSIELAEALVERDIKICKISVPNLSKKLIYLRDKGYNIEDIYRQPSCLHAKYDTLVEKYDLWMKMVFNKPPLFVISSSKKIFEEKLKNELNKKNNK